MKKLATIGLLGLTVALSIQVVSAQTQQKLRVAVISIEAKNIAINSSDVTDIVRYELERSQMYDVIGIHDVNLLLRRAGDNMDDLYSQTLLIERGKVIGADKMLTGSIMSFTDKIIVSLKIVDVHLGQTVKSNLLEFVNSPNEARKMIQISVNKLLGIPVDEHLLTLLTEYETPVDIQGVQNQLNLAGPRFGVGTLLGTTAEELRKYTDISPFYTVLGYQFETRYTTTGDYQMLGEWIFALNGLEKGGSGISFSVSWLNGIRNNKSGFEVGVGALYSIDQNNGPDLRLVAAVGKTIKSGQINFPVNLYVVPSKNRGAVGVIVGFNSKTIAQ